MQQVVVRAFGDTDALELENLPTPEPGVGEVRVRLTSIGMNFAEIMERRGEYKLLSGQPPFVPGLEGGGVIEALGPGVAASRLGERVVLSLDAPRPPADRTGGKHGTYCSHFICRDAQALSAPTAIADADLGCLWLAWLTAWGCLVGRQKLQPGQIVALPGASSAVAIAASQIACQAGCTVIGLTTSADKVAALEALPAARFDHLVVTRDRDWRSDLKDLTKGHGVDVFFDPVAAGEYLNHEIRALAQGGTIWVYGLLGKTGPVDVSPLIRKDAAIRGWSVSEFARQSPDLAARGYRAIFDGFVAGDYQLHVDQRFPLAEVRDAHRVMETGRHIGKLVLIP